ncbi:maltoporin, partial [Cupriavidus basilensis]|nr:maltoporin [Cupriavidus basilensis]
MLFAVSPASGRLPALRSRCLAIAVLAAWGWNACAQTGLDLAAADVPATPTAAQRAATPPEADPLAALISNEQSAAAPIAGEIAGDAPVAAIAQDLSLIHI